MQRRRIRMRRRRIMLTGGLVAIAVMGTANAIKLSQQDVQRIEAHTGKKPEDLTEEQLEAVIDEAVCRYRHPHRHRHRGHLHVPIQRAIT